MKRVFVLLLVMLFVTGITACNNMPTNEVDTTTAVTNETATGSMSTVPEGTQSVQLKVGDVVVIGTYEQDNNTSNGKENIEWLILASEENKALVISKYALDCQPYNTEKTDVTWETCSLRKWLNNTFINNAFTSEERALIVTTRVSADVNPVAKQNQKELNDGINQGNDTQDKIFLLSYLEVSKYFPSRYAQMCAPTDYAIEQGAWISDSHFTTDKKATCWWWLRTIGTEQFRACNISPEGGFALGIGNTVDNSMTAVRPAFWIALEPEF